MPLNFFLPQGVEWIIILFIILPLLFVLSILPIILCVKRAEKVNRNKLAWGILGFFFGYIAVLILYLLLEEPYKKQMHTTLCPYCGEEIFVLAKKCKHCGEWLENK